MFAVPQDSNATLYTLPRGSQVRECIFLDYKTSLRTRVITYMEFDKATPGNIDSVRRRISPRTIPITEANRTNTKRFP